MIKIKEIEFLCEKLVDNFKTQTKYKRYLELKNEIENNPQLKQVVENFKKMQVAYEFNEKKSPEEHLKISDEYFKMIKNKIIKDYFYFENELIKEYNYILDKMDEVLPIDVSFMNEM